MKIKLTLTQEMLGTKALNAQIFGDFIASKRPGGPASDEIENAELAQEAADKAEASGTSIFHRQEEQLGIYDYQIKGFFKDAASAMNRFDKEYRMGMEKLTAFKSKIDSCIFVRPRFIVFKLPKGLEVGICERPIRADTAQGPRVGLCRSETVPQGTELVIDVAVMSKDLKPYVEMWLDYGQLRGLGQWRNSGKGTFTWEEVGGKKGSKAIWAAA
jgi:hypothetical protein